MSIQNQFILILDESGSMGHLTQVVKDKYKELIETLKKESKDKNQRTEVSLYTFAYSPERLFANKNVNKVGDLSNYDYSPNGQTALFDTCGQAITEAKTHPDYEDEDTAWCVIVLTDGQENNSTTYSSSSLVKLFNEVQKTDRWTITFQVPPGSKRELVNTFGIPEGNVREWEGTRKGFEETTVATQSAVSSFYTARSSGHKKVENFYADLGKVKPKDLKSLDDVSDQYHLYEVKQESVIKDFVEKKTKKEFQKGICFYQMTKKELIQTYKDVVVMDNRDQKMYGGKQARKLIGLPENEDAKVDILNLGYYTIFAQSSSDNRKLVRGSKVLIKKNI